MVSKVDQLQQALTRLGAAEAAGRVEARAAAAARTQAEAATTQQGQAGRMPLEQQIRQRLLAVGPGDPQRRRRMLRITLEACFSAEWGDAVLNDPAFHELLDRVQQQIEGDASLQTIVDEALATLTPPPTPAGPHAP
jgi:hypothetical protein